MLFYWASLPYGRRAGGPGGSGGLPHPVPYPTGIFRALWDGGKGVTAGGWRPLDSEHRLSMAKEWQESQGCSLRSDFSRTGKSRLFSGLPGCCPGGGGAEPAWRARSGRAGNGRMARHEHLERINTSPQQGLGRGKNKAGEGKPGQNKMVLVGKGIPASRQGGRNG